MKIHAARTTFYSWYERNLLEGQTALQDKVPLPARVWNRILLENYFLPGDREKQIETFVDYDNHQRHYESLKNLTPADVYFGRGQTVLATRETIKQKTIEKQRLQ